MIIKARSFISTLLSAPLVTVLTIVGVAPGSFAVPPGVTHQQIFPNIQDVNTSILSSASSLPQKQQQQHTQLSEMNLHLVKIISPTKGQQVPVPVYLRITVKHLTARFQL